ncbi:pur operon repressor [Texcoconibacillus texcoconensis]|uniref:Purine operon repressor n=1 Tax=Texcoconibacillus texcoconensis TaxID=1095777 RepID=A0A840QU90_9BACI|nr:pur operon repressor [Texcoconibacillus texcoconensis]MBB5174910.1 purine operon repressor [Texcoconibacillus texcoconensis]
MKFRRSGRLVDMTNYLLNHPHEQVSLSFFSERYQAAKSSISEDLGIVKEVVENQNIGSLQTSAGAIGGATFIPGISRHEMQETLSELCEELQDPERILPGGYLYMMDIIGDPRKIEKLGRILATHFQGEKVDAVMTMATKGIPLAYAVASDLNVPVSIVRHEHRITEGSIVSINYVSGSKRRIETMSLARRSLQPQSRVLIIDDFMKLGGTIQGMKDLVTEFQSTVAGIGVLTEAADEEEKLVNDYVSLTKLSGVNERERKIQVEIGNLLDD